MTTDPKDTPEPDYRQDPAIPATIPTAISPTGVSDAVQVQGHNNSVSGDVEQGERKEENSSTVIAGAHSPLVTAPENTCTDNNPARMPSNEEAIQNLYDTYTATGDKTYLVLIEQLKLIHKSIDYYTRHERWGLLGDLGRAIKLAEEALAKAPPGDNHSKRIALNILGKMLLGRYNRCGTVGDLEQAIKLTQEELELSTPQEPGLATTKLNLGGMLGTRYQQFGAVEDLDKAIKFTEESIQLTPPNYPGRSMSLSNLGLFVLRRWQRTGSMNDLDYSAKLLEETLSEPHLDHTTRRNTYTNLGLTLHARFEKLNRTEDLDKAIDYAEKALEATPLKDPSYGATLGNLGTRIMARYMRSGDIEDLEQAIKRMEGALTALPSGHSERAEVLLSLGALLGTRYQQFSAVEDLNQAIKWIEEAVKASPPRNPSLPDRMSALGKLLQMRGQRLGSIEDLDAAIKLLEEAVDKAPNGHLNRPDMVINLALMVQDRFKQFGNVEDLNKAITLIGNAAESNPSNYSNYTRLAGLGRTMVSRYLRFGAVDDIQQAIKHTEEAVTVMSAKNPHRARYLSTLGEMFHLRYKRFEAVEDLEQALKLAEEVVKIGSANNTERFAWLNNLGSLFDTRYRLFGALEDLEQALEWLEKAVLAAPPTHQDQALMLSNLGVLFQRKYERLESEESLDKAIKWTEQAVKATPSNHTTRGGMLQNLAMSLSFKYNQTTAIEDLSQAIARAKEALEAIPEDAPSQRRRSLRLLGRLLNIRYKRLGDLSSLESAIKFLEEATAALPHDHPERAWTLFSLSEILNSKYILSESTQDLHYILRLLYEGWHSETSPPFFRICAGFRAAAHLGHRRMWQECSSLFGDCVKMLSKLSLGSLKRDDQEYRVSSSVFPPLIPIAVASAFQAGEEASHCLRLLEFGRGLIMGLVINCRSDLSELRLQHQQLHDRFDKLRAEIDSPLAETGSELGGDISTYQARRRREKVVDELDETIVSIRELPGFEGFNLPPSSASSMAVAAEGTIVIVNSMELRSDAIIVTNSIIKSLRLSKLSHSDVEKHMSGIGQITSGGPSTYAERNKKMTETLEWLWDNIVEPVFQELKLGPALGNNPLPRIWWIGVGKLGMAPFHAAGYHSSQETRNTISQAVSSYTPTIKALGYARQKKLELLRKHNPRLLAVTMDTTPGTEWTPLHNAIKEVEDIMKKIKGGSNTVLERPSTSRVLAELPSYDAIHFACHGVSDAKNPSNSSLLLHKEDGTIDRLTVSAISAINIKSAQIAYLSACSTAENASNKVVDESIYIASGFQLAGFSHVLATQWESNDEACRQVATEFYKNLFDGKLGGEKMDHSKVSASFHKAVKQLRRKNLRQPLKWASFIHTGA